MFLSLPGLAEVLDGPKAAQRGVEERQERSDEDIIEEQVAVAVRVGVAELLDQSLQRAEVRAADDRFGPKREQSRRGLGALRTLRRWRGSRRTLLGGHA